MKKQVVRLNESQLNKIIKESVKRVLNERSYNDKGEFQADEYNKDTEESIKREINKGGSY